MEIFWRLILGHLIADFTLQTNYIAAWKRESKWGLLVHCAIHPIIYSILLWNYVGQVWIQVGSLELTGCLCIFLVFITHLIEDEWRIWSVLKQGSPDNTFFYVWDQVIHYAVLFAFSPVVDGMMGKFGLLYYPPLYGVVSYSEVLDLNLWERFLTLSRNETWVFVGILFALVTHFATVTIYFLEKDLLGKNFPSVKEKYISMLERGVVMVCFLLPGFWWISVVLLWISRSILYRIYRWGDFSWIHIFLGNGIAILCGIIVRHLVYGN